MSNNQDIDDMEPEYDFSNAVRGKHYQSYQQGTNVILLDSDLAEIFKDSESVNHALRMLVDIAGKELQSNLTKNKKK